MKTTKEPARRKVIVTKPFRITNRVATVGEVITLSSQAARAKVRQGKATWWIEPVVEQPGPVADEQLEPTTQVEETVDLVETEAEAEAGADSADTTSQADDPAEQDEATQTPSEEEVATPAPMTLEEFTAWANTSGQFNEALAHAEALGVEPAKRSRAALLAAYEAWLEGRVDE